MRKQSFTVILVLIANFEAIRVRNSSKNKNVLPVKYVVEFNYALIFRSGLKNVVAYAVHIYTTNLKYLPGKFHFSDAKGNLSHYILNLSSVYKVHSVYVYSLHS